MVTTEKQILYAKIEAAYNTDPTTAATDAYRVIDPAYKLDPHIYRPAIGGIRQCTPNPAQIGMRWPDFSFKQEVRGNSTALDGTHRPAMDPFIRACGFDPGTWDGVGKTWTYAWVDEACESLWVELNTGGLFQPSGGCRGTFDLELTPGERAVMSYSFQGNYQPIDEVAMTAPTYDDCASLLVQGIQLAPYGMASTPGAVKNRVTKATLNLRGEVYRLPDVNGAEGIGEVFVLGMGSPTDRGPQLTMEVTRDDAAHDAWWNQFLNRSLGAACSITLGSTALGLKQQCVFSFPGGLYVDGIEDITIGSLRGHKLTCSVPGTVAGPGEDAIGIVWTQGV